MKDGCILHQGTLEDIRDENPELVANWRATESEMIESESELSAAEDVKQERAKLIRQCSVKLEEEKKLEQGWFGWCFCSCSSNRGFAPLCLKLRRFNYALRHICIDVIFLFCGCAFVTCVNLELFFKVVI